MSATDTEFFQRGFGAPVPGFELVPFGDLPALQAALAARPEFFAAFMLEIIQGESGIRVAPPGYLAAARDLCHQHGVLLIVDEVQTGLGRTGRLFACEAEGVTPDILALAKALGGGLMPIGACLYTRDAYTEQFDLRHGSTFAGNTLACRAALATINELTKDDRRLVRHVAAIGDRLLERLREVQSEYPALVKEIRGRGLMLGVELDLGQVARHPERPARDILQEQGLLLYMAGELSAQRRAHPHRAVVHPRHGPAHRAPAHRRRSIVRSSDRRIETFVGRAATRRSRRAARAPHGQIRLPNAALNSARRNRMRAAIRDRSAAVR